MLLSHINVSFSLLSLSLFLKSRNILKIKKKKKKLHHCPWSKSQTPLIAPKAGQDLVSGSISGPFTTSSSLPSVHCAPRLIRSPQPSGLRIAVPPPALSTSCLAFSFPSSSRTQTPLPPPRLVESAPAGVSRSRLAKCIIAKLDEGS